MILAIQRATKLISILAPQLILWHGAQYIEESIECYVAGLYKAAAVMVGASAECLILELRDTLISKLDSLARKVPKDLADWRVKRAPQIRCMHFCLPTRTSLPQSLERSLRLTGQRLHSRFVPSEMM